MNADAEIDALAQIVWDYHQMGHSLRKSDCIFVLCSNDPRVARYGAELYLRGFAPLIIFSGAVGALTRGLYATTEAETFAGIAEEMGVPHEQILIENRASNTGENVLFTKELLSCRKLEPRSFILVQKPYMERRTFATFKQLWPEPEAVVTSPPISFSEYPTETLPRDRVIEIMLGDLQRIREYPARGFQIEQEIPAAVWAAFERLVQMGFDRHLLRSTINR